MTQQLTNPLVAIANTARTFNEQANTTVKALSDSITQASNTVLTGLAQGLPGLPGLGGGNPGRGNTHNGGAVNIAQQLLAPFSQLEDVLLPPGLPRPSQVLLGTGRAPAPRVQEAAAASNAKDAPPPPAAPARARVPERRGY